LTEIGSKTAEKNSAQTNKQTDRQTDNGHLAVNEYDRAYPGPLRASKERVNRHRQTTNTLIVEMKYDDHVTTVTSRMTSLADYSQQSAVAIG